MTRAALEADPLVRRILDAGAATDLNLLGVGACDFDSAFFRVAGVVEEDMRAAIAAGAVCEVAGHFLRADGTAAETRLNECRVGVGLEALRRGENVIVAAGARKVQPLKALLRSGLATTLVINHEIAAELAKG